MGNATHIEDEDITITDEAGLKLYIQKVMKGELYADKPQVKEYVKALNHHDDKLLISFLGWDEWKIISYWYEEMVIVLRDLAVFIEGTVYLDFCNRDEAGGLTFDDGECIIETGQMHYQERLPEQMRTNLPEMPKFLKERLTIQQI